jgi:hypothetical protein
MDTLDHEGRAAVEWIVSMRAGMAVRREFPDDTLHVSYEELCTEPRLWTERIEAFMGLDRDDVLHSYAENVLAAKSDDIQLDIPKWLSEIVTATELEIGSLGSDYSKEHA